MAVWKRILVSGSNISDLNNNVGYATTGSNTFQGNQTINGNVIITGSLTAQQYILSSSVIYVTESNFSGSHVFGNSLDDTHQFTGSVLITGSSTLVGNQTITGSILMSGSLTDAYISTVNWIDFNSNIPAGSPAFNTGRLHWVDDTKTLGLDTDVNGSVIELGHQNVVRVVNQTGVTISKGSIVYISGSQGTRPGIATASYTDENDSATTLGFVMHDIVGSGGNTNGYVVTRGLIREVNTSGMIAGASLYLSSSGQYSTSKPQAPLHDVRLGKVIVGGSTGAGVIYVDIQNGYEIDELHNVRIIGDTTGDLIIKSGSLWINSKILTGSYILSGSLTTNDGVSVQTLTASFVSASSGITGSLFGTASWATQALTSSKVYLTASAVNATFPVIFSDSQTPTTTAGGEVTGLNVDAGLRFNPSTNLLNVNNILSTGTITASSGFSGNLTGNVTGNLTGTSSWATNALTASFLPVGTYNVTSSWATNALTASFLPVGTYNITSSQALTASFTPNALVTASVSSNVLTFTKGNGTTFNLTVNTGSGGGGTPGGGNTDIQINSGSSFYGTTDFQFQWDASQQNREQLRHRYQYNFAGNPYTSIFNSSYVPINRANDLGQHAGITHWQTSLPATTGATTIYAFDAGMNAGTTLQMYGFKCDYSIMLNDGTNNAAARVGTLMGAWNNNTAATPALTDTFADGDVDLLELGTVIFTLIWTGNNIELQMDCTNVTSGDTYFNGIFTNFGSTL